MLLWVLDWLVETHTEIGCHRKRIHILLLGDVRVVRDFSRVIYMYFSDDLSFIVILRNQVLVCAYSKEERRLHVHRDDLRMWK